MYRVAGNTLNASPFRKSQRQETHYRTQCKSGLSFQNRVTACSWGMPSREYLEKGEQACAGNKVFNPVYTLLQFSLSISACRTKGTSSPLSQINYRTHTPILRLIRSSQSCNRLSSLPILEIAELTVVHIQLRPARDQGRPRNPETNRQAPPLQNKSQSPRRRHQCEPNMQPQTHRRKTDTPDQRQKSHTKSTPNSNRRALRTTDAYSGWLLKSRLKSLKREQISPKTVRGLIHQNRKECDPGASGHRRRPWQ